jgi:hypothetical protein
MINWLATLASGMALVAVVGCRSQSATPVRYLDQASERAAIENRAALVFTNAILLKPRETFPATDSVFALAPLLIQEVVGLNAASNNGQVKVFYQPGAVQIGGVTRPQMTYLWSCGHAKKLTHGFRLTLDSGGLPAIWEVLDARPGAHVMFVSQSLEERAKTAFGPPVPGRRFSIEQPLNVAPNVVVARVIEAGPAAMGPIVHQTASGEISAVICRCMPTQAHQLVGTAYYEFKPLSALANGNLETLGTNRCLVEELRLPPAF